MSVTEDPARRLAVVACVDARLDIYRILGPNEGDAHVVRNAGRAVTHTDVVRGFVFDVATGRLKEVE